MQKIIDDTKAYCEIFTVKGTCYQYLFITSILHFLIQEDKDKEERYGSFIDTIGQYIIEEK